MSNVSNVNIGTLVNSISADLLAKMDPTIVTRYWAEYFRVREESDPKAKAKVESYAAPIPAEEPSVEAGVTKAERNETLEWLRVFATQFSYASIAHAMYGKPCTRGVAYRVRKWAIGLQGCADENILLLRKFRSEVEQGMHKDTLRPAGRNRGRYPHARKAKAKSK